jgi:hypothetical protein
MGLDAGLDSKARRTSPASSGTNFIRTSTRALAQQRAGKVAEFIPIKALDSESVRAASENAEIAPVLTKITLRPRSRERTGNTSALAEVKIMRRMEAGLVANSGGSPF